MALDKMTGTSSAPHHSTRSRSELSDLERISDETRELVQNGAASKNATAAQKFALGDRVTELLTLLRHAEERAALTEDSRAFLELCRNRLDELLDGHPVSRGTLVNYGKVSRVFGPDHDIRRSDLHFSIAKTLCSLEDEGERDYWYAQVLLRGMPVKDLQDQLSSRRGPDSGITNLRKQSKAFICAQTGQQITEDLLKTMVVVHPPSFGGPTIQELVERRGRRRTTTEVSSSSKASSPKPLRFRDMAALAAWSEAHKREYPEAGSTPTSPDANASGENAGGGGEEHTTDTERHVTDAANAPANDISAFSMVDRREDSSSR